MKPEKKTMILFLSPAILMFALVFVYPTVRSIAMSFFRVTNVTDATSKWAFVGIGNYQKLISSSLSRQAFSNVFLIWFFGGVAVLGISIIFSAMLTYGMKGKSAFRAMMYLPNVVATIAWGTVWLQGLYSNEYGMFKNFFEMLGIESLAKFQWTSKDNIFWAMLVAYSVTTVGYYVLIFIAGIDRIPRDYYECATIEGAGVFSQFFRITLPMLRDVLRTSIVLWSINALGFFVWTQVFSRLQVSTQTVTPMAFMYQVVFGREFVATDPDLMNAGLGAAVGVVLTLLVVIVFLLANLVLRTDKDLEY